MCIAIHSAYTPVPVMLGALDQGTPRISGHSAWQCTDRFIYIESAPITRGHSVSSVDGAVALHEGDRYTLENS